MTWKVPNPQSFGPDLLRAFADLARYLDGQDTAEDTRLDDLETNVAAIQAMFYTSAAWTPFTPTLSGWTLGNGLISGKYFRVARFAAVKWHLTVGSTTSLAGNPQFSLPAACPVVTERHEGYARMIDASAGLGFQGDVEVYPSTCTPFTRGSVGLGTLISSTHPFTWATSDEMDCGCWYECSS